MALSERPPSKNLLTLGEQNLRVCREDKLWQLISLVADLYWQEDSEFVCLSLRCDDTEERQQLYVNFPGRTPWEFGIIPVVEPKSTDDHFALRAERKPFTDQLYKLVSPMSVGYLRVSGEAQFDQAGEFLGYHCLARDVSQQRKIEHRLLRFRAAMDMSTDMIYLVDRQTMRFVDVNDTACKNSGFTRAQLLNSGPADTLSETEAEIAARYDHLISEGGSSRIESSTFNRHGEPVVVEVYSRAMQIDERWIIIGMTRDITSRKNVERNSQRLQQMFSALSESNEAILRATSVTSLYTNVCNAAVKGGKFNIATVFEPIDQHSLASVALAGEATPIVEPVKLSTNPDRSQGQGLSGIAFRTRMPCISHDFQNDPRTAPWHAISRLEHIASAAALPLFKRKRCVAVLLFYSTEKDAFDDDIVKLLESMAANVSYALDSFETQAEREQTEHVLRESEARFRSLTHLSSDSYWELDENHCFSKYEGNVVGDANERAIKDLFGNNPWNIKGITPGSMNRDMLKIQLEKHQPFRDFECSFTNDERIVYHFSLSAEPRFNEQGEFTGYRGISRDISDQKRVSEHITYLATHDHLTNLPNRVMFGKLLEQATRTAMRYPEQAFSVLFIDLDRFKSVNDTHGHHVGDRLLTEIAGRLRKPLRASDIVARLGGDEFVILLQNVAQRMQIEKIAQNILNEMTGSITLEGKECQVTASIGISIFGIDADDEETLMKHADAAMYIAKDEGKNNYQFYSPDVHILTREKVDLEFHLRHALERGEFSLHYQAQLHLSSGHITGVEALLRWNSSVLGHITPDRFIPIAEETGQILAIGDWVLQTACQQVSTWNKEGHAPLALAVNLSSRQFNDPDLLNRIKHALELSAMPAEMLELEITESSVVHSPERAYRLMSQIKELGVKLALDDFGTGYSSLRQLKHYPIDTLKIDRSFIEDIPHNKEDNAISTAIISMGNTLGLRVVAEGIEQLEQLEFLREHHCQELQGYYLHKPANGDQFFKWYLQHDPTRYLYPSISQA